jgi:hypothetical protein
LQYNNNNNNNDDDNSWAAWHQEPSTQWHSVMSWKTWILTIRTFIFKWYLTRHISQTDRIWRIFIPSRIIIHKFLNLNLKKNTKLFLNSNKEMLSWKPL